MLILLNRITYVNFFFFFLPLFRLFNNIAKYFEILFIYDCNRGRDIVEIFTKDIYSSLHRHVRKKKSAQCSHLFFFFLRFYDYFFFFRLLFLGDRINLRGKKFIVCRVLCVAFSLFSNAIIRIEHTYTHTHTNSSTNVLYLKVYKSRAALMRRELII